MVTYITINVSFQLYIKSKGSPDLDSFINNKLPWHVSLITYITVVCPPAWMAPSVTQTIYIVAARTCVVTFINTVLSEPSIWADFKSTCIRKGNLTTHLSHYATIKILILNRCLLIMTWYWCCSCMLMVLWVFFSLDLNKNNFFYNFLSFFIHKIFNLYSLMLFNSKQMVVKKMCFWWIAKVKVTVFAKVSCISLEASIYTHTSNIITACTVTETFIDAVFSEEPVLAR